MSEPAQELKKESAQDTALDTARSPTSDANVDTMGDGSADATDSGSSHAAVTSEPVASKAEEVNNTNNEGDTNPEVKSTGVTTNAEQSSPAQNSDDSNAADKEQRPTQEGAEQPPGTDPESSPTVNAATEEGKRKSEESTAEPDPKKPKTEEASEAAVSGGAQTETSQASTLEKAKAAAERSRIDLYPELDPVELPPPGTGLLKHQHKYALSAIRAIKRSKDAGPFLAPVDPVRQGVPHYFDYIQHPMDLGTIEKKLADNKYDSVQALVDDFNLMVSNCIIFNGEDALISKMALGIAQSFKKQLSNMPTYDATRKGSQAAAAAAAASSSASNAPAPAHTNGTASAATAAVVNGDDESALHEDHVGKRSSTTTTIVGPNGLPTLRRKSTIDGRPKREIRPPRHAGSFAGSGTGEGRPRNKKYASELRFAGQVLREMQSRKLEAIAFPFMQPVDPIEQGVPTYFDVIKEPMDLSTIQRKLAEGIYYTGDEFESDVRLMFRNCYTFNPEGTPVNVMGHKLEAYFDSRWIEKPIPGAPAAEDSEASDVDEEFADAGLTNPAIQVLEDQIRLVKKQIKKLKKEALADYYKRGHRRSAAPKRRRSSNAGSGSGASSHKPLPTEMTYDMKRELRDKIDKLPEKKIQTVIAIIQESMPDLGKGQEEIELEVDALDTNTLLRLYNYAVLGRREEPASLSGGVSGASGAGAARPLTHDYDNSSQGVKRRSKALSEEEHEKRIAQIESKLKEFADASGQPISSSAATAALTAGSAVSAIAAESDSSDDERFESDDSSSEEE